MKVKDDKEVQSAKKPPQPAPAATGGRSPMDKSARHALIARDLLIPSSLAAIIGEEFVGAAGVKVYVNGFYRDAGFPADPVELVLLDQLLLCHHRLAKLHVQADAAKSADHIKILNAAAARLTGEVRRLALSIRAYRQPPAQRSFNVVHQQNVVAQGEQQVQYVDAGQGKATLVARDGVNGNGVGSVDRRLSGDDISGDITSGKEPGAGSGGAGQRADATSVDG